MYICKYIFTYTHDKSDIYSLSGSVGKLTEVARACAPLAGQFGDPISDDSRAVEAWRVGKPYINGLVMFKGKMKAENPYFNGKINGFR